MNVRNFSLDFLQPSGTPRATALLPPASKPSVEDPWAEAVRYYGEPVFKTLQEGGAKSVQDLFAATKTVLKVPDLQIDQFAGVVWRMIESGKLAVVRQGPTVTESSVALPIKP